MPVITLGNVAEVESIKLKRKKNSYKKRNGETGESSEIQVSADTADVVAMIVFVLAFAGLLISLGFKDLREAVFTGMLPGLFGILMCIVGGVEALRIFK